MSYADFYYKKVNIKKKYSKNKKRRIKLNKIQNILLINSLIIDKYFNIYNRNGFEYVINDIKKFKIYLLDFDNIKEKNSKFGYSEVNNKFKMLFEQLKDNYIIGRAFSGDEIFFLSENINDNINNIKDICITHDFKFKYIEDIYNNDINISDFLEKMIKNFH